jgi:hypothetical protein
LALDRLDELQRRPNRQRIVFLCLLVTAPRASAFVTRDLSQFDPAKRRIEYGEDVGKKRKGVGSLDEKTAGDLGAHLSGRTEGPLFLSPQGSRHTKEGLLDLWREAFGLGTVDALWPEDEPRDLELAYFVNLALRSGRPRVSRGGNPSIVKSETLVARSELESKVSAFADRLRTEWERRLRGVDNQAFRKTHRTWAEVLGGVPGIVIDRQLGHSAHLNEDSVDIARLHAGSRTGRDFYFDSGFGLLDAARSARAVRDVVDKAIADVSQHPTCLSQTRRVSGSAAQVVPKSVPMDRPSGLTSSG